MEGRETGISHTDKTVEREGGTGEEKHVWEESPCSRKTVKMPCDPSPCTYLEATEPKGNTCAPYCWHIELLLLAESSVVQV